MNRVLRGATKTRLMDMEGHMNMHDLRMRANVKPTKLIVEEFSLRYFAHFIRAENDVAKLMFGYMDRDH